MRKKIVVLGYGQRGRIYAGYSLLFSEEFEVVAIVDNDEKKLADAKREFSCPVFSEYQQFLKAKISADIVVVSTQDSDHREHAIACMEAGYDLLLEKPIAPTLEDCAAIYDAATRLGRKVVVCHVLRYTPFYKKVKEIVDSGVLGNIQTLAATENVGYYHQAHSFVRGPWRNSEQSSPMILAKCCHDMDMIRWLIGERCEKVSSFGGLSYFTNENAPAGAAAYCSECLHTDCIYKAQKLYLEYQWMASYFTNGERTEENILSSLKGTQYDKCVFKTDNDVVDHQVTIMQFAKGITAMHQMTAFSKEIYRGIKISGTKADLFGVMEQNRIEIRVFGGDTYTVPVDFDEVVYGNHGGGDQMLMHDLYLELNGLPTKGITYLDVSMDSHKMALKAEKSRITGNVEAL